MTTAAASFLVDSNLELSEVEMEVEQPLLVSKSTKFANWHWLVKSQSLIHVSWLVAY